MAAGRLLLRHFNSWQIHGGRHHWKCITQQHLPCRTNSNYSGPPPTEPSAGAFRSPKKVFGAEWKHMTKKEQTIPRETDIVILGGGLVGMATAYFLKKHNPVGYSVTVVEKDTLYTHSASSLSVGGIRHQFSLPENIRMSLFASDFLREVRHELAVLDLESPDVMFNPQGYLLLANDSEAQLMERDHQTQISCGANVDLLSRDQLRQQFPWLNVDDTVVGTYGLEKEGWLDPWLLLAALKAKTAELGTQFVTGEVVGFAWSADVVSGTSGDTLKKRKSLKHVHIRTDDGRVFPLQFAICVNCAGASSRDIARLAGIGMGDGALGIDIPIVPRKQYVYMLRCAAGPGFNMPMLADKNGIFVRREGLGGHYLCSAIPPLVSEASVADSSEEYFKSTVRPYLVRRIPVFETLELVQSWTGFLEYNYFDENLVLGNHPYYRNFVIAAGGACHGSLHAPAIGRGLTELIVRDGYSELDLSPFTFDRVLDDEPLVERLIL